MQGAHAVIPRRKTQRKLVITCHTRTLVTSTFGATGIEAKYMVLNNHVLVLHGRSNRTMSTIVIFAYRMLFPSAQRVKHVIVKQTRPRGSNEHPQKRSQEPHLYSYMSWWASGFQPKSSCIEFPLCKDWEGSVSQFFLCRSFFWVRLNF